MEENAPEEARRRQAAQLAPLGLEPDPAEALKKLLAGLKAGLNETERGLQVASQGVHTAESSRQIASLLAQRPRRIEEAAAEIRRQLPAGVVERIDRHVRTHVKSRIVIYGAQ